jgi:hypothetical protein
MQTFLPYKSFVKSAACLDNKRLGKQRVEAYQLLNALLGLTHKPGSAVRKGWTNHPAALMWKGHEGVLYQYACIVCDEWKRRGFKNEAMEANLLRLFNVVAVRLIKTSTSPTWLGSRKFHASHRSNLLRKDAAWYGKFNWKEPADLEYV